MAGFACLITQCDVMPLSLASCPNKRSAGYAALGTLLMDDHLFLGTHERFSFIEFCNDADTPTTFFYPLGDVSLTYFSTGIVNIC